MTNDDISKVIRDQMTWKQDRANLAKDDLLRRAAELLRSAYEAENDMGKWEDECDQWLRDAGMEK